MRRPPRPPSESIFDPQSRLMLAVAAAALTAGALVVGGIAPGDVDAKRTAVFLTLGLGQLGVALALRSRSDVRHRARGLVGGVVAAFVLMALAVYAPGFDTLLQTVPPALPTLAVVAAAAAVPGVLLRTLRGRASRGGR